MLKAAPVDRRQLRQWQCTVCSTETLTCSTTDPQAQEAARGVAGADASTRGRVVGSLLAGDIADDEAAITTAIVRRICFCCGAAQWARLIGKDFCAAKRSAARPTNSCSDFRKSLVYTDNPPSTRARARFRVS